MIIHKMNEKWSSHGRTNRTGSYGPVVCSTPPQIRTLLLVVFCLRMNVHLYIVYNMIFNCLL